jgi:ABC-type thiamine transport system ATPase subunit
MFATLTVSENLALGAFTRRRLTAEAAVTRADMCRKTGLVSAEGSSAELLSDTRIQVAYLGEAALSRFDT